MNNKNQCFWINTIVLLGFVLAVPVAQAATAVGVIQGSFTTTPMGQAAYTIPLPAPGGAAGFSPSLSIQYVSGSGEGLLGWDTTIGGLSKITRCPSTWPYDGSTAPVNLTSRDRFCLDGRELSLKTSTDTYGGNGVIYLTTPTAHMEAVSTTSNTSIGPDYFVVHHADGSKWEYGNTSDSYVTAVNGSGTTVPRAWLLDKITDANGNSITFHYTQPSGTGAYYLSEVDWGSNTNPDHAYVFSYTTVGADATVYRYVAGNQITWNERVSKITLEYNGATTLTWTPSYVADGQGSNRSRLHSLTECDANGNCFPATNFTWPQDTAGFGAATNTGQSATTTAYKFVEDVNGDGLEDLVYDCGGVWCVRFGQSGGGFGSGYSTGVTVTEGAWAQPIHYVYGAADQILVDDGGVWKIISWTGSGFSSPITTGISVSGGIAASDVNGDGLDDLVTYNGGTIYVRLNNASLTSPGFNSPITAYTDNNMDTFIGFTAIGENGSRGPSHQLHFSRYQSGVVLQYHHSEQVCSTTCNTISWYGDEAFVWDNGALSLYGSIQGATGSTSAPEVFPLDVNGDGLTDLVVSGTAKLLLNTGSGFSTVQYGSSTSGLALSSAVAADYNGNGRDDLLVPSTSTGDWMLLASTGSGFSAPVDTGIASGSFGSTPEVADTEGRMLSDLVGANSSGDVEIALRNGPYPDLLTEIEDGLGNYNNFSWVPLSNSTIVQDTPPIASGFELDRRGQYILSSDKKNNGIGGTYTLSYDYGAPIENPGVGLAGINKIVESDSRTNAPTKTSKFDVSNYAYDVIGDISYAQKNGNLILDKLFVYSTHFLNQSQPLMPKKLIITHYDSSGNPLYSVTSAYTYDSDYVLSDDTVTTEDLTGSGKQWVSDVAIQNNENTTTQYYCMNLKSSVTVTDTPPSGTSISRETTFTAGSGDKKHCRYTSKTSDANLATALQTTTNYGYNGFGDITSVSVIGHNPAPSSSAMAARTTTYGYDSLGEFRTSVTDAAGDVTNASWDGAFGVKNSETASSGSVTSYAYDGFGRLAKTTLPTGAYSSVSLSECTSSCSRWIIRKQTDTYTSTGSISGERWNYYDRYGRLYENAVERLGGGIARAFTIYNSLGQVASKYMPRYSGNSAYHTTNKYDALGRIKEIDIPYSTSTTTTAVTTATYNGYTTTIAGPNGYSKTVIKNPLGQVKQVTDAGGNSSAYTYGAFGELTQAIGADGATTKLSYDGAGNRILLSGPDRGSLSFKYDSLGEMVEETNALGQAINMVYDPLGRVVQRTFPNPSGSGTETQTWTYSSSGNSAGQLTRESDNVTGFSRSLTYNSYGKPTTVTETLSGTSLALNVAYDSLGRMSSVTYPVTVGGKALTVDYAYDGSGNLDKVSNPNDGTVYWQPNNNLSTPAMNALGQMEAYILGGSLDVERLHDAATGAVTSITSGPNGSGSILNLTSSYNENGSRLTLNDLNESLDDSYQYDNYQRLVQVKRTGTAGTTYSNFSYGAAGQIDEGPGGVYQYGSAPDPAHSPISVGTGGLYSFSYNAAGERTQWTSPSLDLAPVAKASASPSPLSSAGTITLDGSASYDQDSGPQPLSYQWSVISQPSGASVSITNATSADASVSVSLAGSYIFGLTVSDGQMTDSTQVTVQANILPTLASAPGLSPNPSSSGNYTVSWSKPSNNTKSFQLDESSNSGSSWSRAYSGTNTKWSPSSAKPDGSYEYKLKNCNSIGCSGWSGTSTENVQIAPGAPALSPNPSDTGNYTVSWPSVPGAASYDLDQSGSQVYSGSATSWSPSSAQANGSHTYKVRSCSSGGCSAFSGTSTETVNLTPGVPTNLRINVLTSGAGGTYLVEWNAPSYGAVTQYDLERSTTSSFSSSTTYTISQISHSFTYGSNGVTHYYRVRACHNSYCGGWSSTLTETDPTSSSGGGCKTCSPTLKSKTVSPSAGTSTGGGAGADPTVTWDAIGKARTIKTSSATINLVYSPDGDLVQDSGNDGGFYLGPWLKSTDSNDWSARIIAMGRVIAVVKDSAGSVSTSYLLRGPLDSTQAVASGAGGLIQRIAYSAWGSFVQPGTGTGSVTGSSIAKYTTVTYTGQELITGTGLINMGARIYDPATGIFLSPDPTVVHPYDTQDLNQYAYVEDNPMTLIDPRGYTYGATNTCAGPTRALGNTGRPLESQLFHSFGFYPTRGGAFGMLEAPGTANVDPAQFGLTNSTFAEYAPFISGTITTPEGTASFNGVTDVIGGKFGTPVPGMNTRAGFEHLYKGALIVELNSGPDLGVGKITLSLPAALPCPKVTPQASSSNASSSGKGSIGSGGGGLGTVGGSGVSPFFQIAWNSIPTTLGSSTVGGGTISGPDPGSSGEWQCGNGICVWVPKKTK